MALRGSLLEFELPNIFQLIGNDGKTGQLVLYRKEQEAFVIFSHGAIIAAGNSAMNLQTVLFKFLIAIKNYSEEELNELLYLCQGEMKVFSQALVNKNYLSKEELIALTRTSVEDLACGLFLWEQGHYRFDFLDSVEEYMIGSVSISTDAITMEAMRRVDEWKRMQKKLQPTTVFVHVNAGDLATSPEAQNGPGFDPATHILSLVDGVSSIATIAETGFFTEYRVFETLLGFWKNNRIMPTKTSQGSRKPELEEKSIHRFAAINSGLIFFALVHIGAAAIFLLGYIFNHSLLNQRNKIQQRSATEITLIQSENAVRIASLCYHELTGVLPIKVSQLRDLGLITSADGNNYKLRTIDAGNKQ